MSHVIELSPVSSSFFVTIGAVLLIVLAGGLLVGGLALSATRARIVVDERGLTLSGAYGRTIARADIRAEGVRRKGAARRHRQPPRGLRADDAGIRAAGLAGASGRAHRRAAPRSTIV